MPGHLARGHRAAGRYRLEKELGRGSACRVWRCTDETLERAVALRFFDPGLDRSKLMERAGVAASLTHHNVVRIFDTGFDGGQFFTVCELLPGSLDWAGLPLGADDALRAGIQIAEALAYAHERGVAHGALVPGNILMGEQGVKVADFALSASALAGEGLSQRHDLVQLGDLLYLLLTGRGATAGARPLADEPRGLSGIVMDLRNGAYADARSVLAALRALAPSPPAPPKRWWIVAAVFAAGLLIGLAAVGATRLGRRSEHEPRTAPPRVAGKPHRVASVADYDPLADGREGHRTVTKITDASPQTFWSTERYRSSPDFSGRKSGVGVIIDLGAPKPVANARVLLVTAGCSFQIRFSPVRARSVEDWKVAASVRNAGTTAVARVEGESSRWWLLWITRLTKGVPGAGNAYACGVGDVALYPP